MSFLVNRRPLVPDVFLSAGYRKETSSQKELAGKRMTLAEHDSESSFTTTNTNDSTASIDFYTPLSSSSLPQVKPRLHPRKDPQEILKQLDEFKHYHTAQKYSHSLVLKDATALPQKQHEHKECGELSSSDSSYSLSSSYGSYYPSSDSSIQNLKDLKNSHFIQKKGGKPLIASHSLQVVNSPETLVAISESTDTANPSSSATSVHLRSMRKSWRKIKDRNASMRQLRAALQNQGPGEEATPAFTIASSSNVALSSSMSRSGVLKPELTMSTADEELLRNISEHHRLAMLKISAAEDSMYESRWMKLRQRNAIATRVPLLRFHQIPWPLLTPIIFSPADITLKNVERFLLSPYRKPSLTARRKVLNEMARWEPREFEMTILKEVAEGDRERVRGGAERLRELFQEILKKRDEKNLKPK